MDLFDVHSDFYNLLTSDLEPKAPIRIMILDFMILDPYHIQRGTFSFSDSVIS